MRLALTPTATRLAGLRIGAFWGPGVRSGCAIPGVSARSRQHERMDRAVAEVTKALLELAAPQPGERVLDIGCGSGTTTLELAARVGPDGHVLGADIAEQSVARARERIATAGLRHAEVIVADVSSQPFEPNSFDLSFSRFGVMFLQRPRRPPLQMCAVR
jgi:SAM-dependent methyltransferase